MFKIVLRKRRMPVPSPIKTQRILLKPTPRVGQFFLISLALHMFVALSNYLMPQRVIKSPERNMIQVRFLPKELKVPEKKMLIKNSNQNKRATLNTQKRTSDFDRKTHFNVKPKIEQKYTSQKTRTSKSNKIHAIKQKHLRNKLKSFLKLEKPEKKKYIYKNNLAKFKNGATIITMQKDSRASIRDPRAQPANPISVLEMLDRLDASKYASFDNDVLGIEDEDEPISLDTKEAKYADYFSRIKFLIEQVWTYPLEAARRGISGEITLKFKLSKEGNLIGFRMVESSGTEVLDRAALQAVKKAAPYYPFPPEITKDKITILATFIYSPTYSNNAYFHQ